MTNQQYLSAQVNKTTGFVFAGGGSLGAVQVGILKALSQAGIKPDMLVGASVGALNAAYFGGNPTVQGAELLEKIWLELIHSEILKPKLMHTILALTPFEASFLDSNILKSLIQKQIQYENLEEALVPVHIVATDAFDGAEVVISKGNVVTALMASTAVPGVFPPVTVGKQILIDGGVTNNTPISAAIFKGAELIVILPTGSPCAISKIPKGAIPMILHALNLMIISQLVRDIQHFADKVEILVVPPICPITSSVHDFSQTKKLIRHSFINTTRWLRREQAPSGKIPGALYPHHHEDKHKNLKKLKMCDQ